MKKWLLCGLVICSVIASAASVEDLTYTISDNQVTITDCDTSASGELEIPSTIEGCPVTTIGYEAFSGCSSLTSVTIPEGVTTIGAWAFMDCKSLTTVTIPEGVTTIEFGVFAHCKSLTSVTIPEGVTSIGYSVFYNCLSLTSVTIPEGVTSIGYSVFYNCSSLTSVIIPSSVTTIGDEAFSGCSSLTSVTIPKSVAEIGSLAFFGCSGLNFLIFEGEPPMASSDSFKEVSANGYYTPDYADAWEAVISDGLWNGLTMKKGTATSVFTYTISDETVTITGLNDGYPAEIVIPSTIEGYPVTKIGDGAFNGCSSLTSVIIPETVTSIGANGFYNCSGLTSIVIPESVTSIEWYTFWGCTGLTSVVIPKNVTYIGSYAFWSCRSLTSVIISSGVTLVEWGAFWGCSGLTTVTIPSTVTKIGACAFESCTNLTLVVLEGEPPTASSDIFKGVTATGYYTTDHADAWEAVITDGQWNGLTMKKVTATSYFTYTINEGKVTITGLNEGYPADIIIPEVINGYPVTSIGREAFRQYSDLTSVVIPEGVTSIETYAFYGCSALTSVTIPSSVTSIEGGAFLYCSNLTSVTIPEGITSIGNSTFSGCTSLASVTLPESLTLIYGYAFYNCSSLTSVTIPENVTSIEYNAFNNCTGLTSITFEGDPPTASSSSFNNVTATAYYSFEHVDTWSAAITEGQWNGLTTKLNSVLTYTIENGQVTITHCDEATSGELKIPSIIDGYPVTTIGHYAFEMCHSLTTITIPEGVTSISFCAFFHCIGLTSITIPSTVTTIEDYAFEMCHALTTVTFKGAPPTVAYSPFMGTAATGYYTAEYMTDWEAAVDTNYQWNGLPMRLIGGLPVTVNVVGDGTVTGAHYYLPDTEATVVATPGEGMVFCGWSTTPVNASTSYTFTMPTEDVTLTAYFAPAVAVSAYVGGQGLLTPSEADQKTQDYIADNDLMSKDEAKQALLDADEVFTADEMKEMAFGAPVMEVKDDVVEVAISLQTAESLDAWQAMALQGATLEVDEANGVVRVKVPKGDSNAAFYKFVVPEEQ